jgi:hypothetical protein
MEGFAIEFSMGAVLVCIRLSSTASHSGPPARSKQPLTEELEKERDVKLHTGLRISTKPFFLELECLQSL